MPQPLLIEKAFPVESDKYVATCVRRKYTPRVVRIGPPLQDRRIVMEFVRAVLMSDFAFLGLQKVPDIH